MLEAREFYDARRKGLGRELLLDVQRTLEIIGGNPFLYAAFENDVRRALTKGFPYSIYYIVEDEKVTVLGVLHQNSSAAKIQDRI